MMMNEDLTCTIYDEYIYVLNQLAYVPTTA